MDKPIQAGQQFAWALYTLRRGCALWIPEPNKELTSQYRQNGVQIGDVGILKADGSFDFVFNVCCSANDPINQYGVPTDFQTLSWNGAKCRTDNIFRPGEPVLSRGAEKWVLGVEGTAPVLGIPVSGGAELSIRSAKSRGAVIFPVNGVDSVDCEDLAVFRNYVERHAVSWYRFINETLGMEVENGAIYFITGFDKTSCWENAVFSNNMGERNCEVIINTGGLPGGDRFRLSDSSLRVAFSSRCSPPDNVRHNQALFIRGFRISMPRKFKALFNRSGVEVTSTYEASLKNVPGKDGSHFPSNHGAPPSPGSEVSTASSWSKISSSVISSSPSNEARSAYAWVDGNTSQELGDFPPSPRLCHPLKVINDYILQTVKARHDVEVVITHDEDWIALVKGEDIEMPDEPTLLKRLSDLYHIAVKEGCASLDRIEGVSCHSCKVIAITNGNQDVSNGELPAPEAQSHDPPLVQCPLSNSEPGVDASPKGLEAPSKSKALTDAALSNASRSEQSPELLLPSALVPLAASMPLPAVVIDSTSAPLTLEASPRTALAKPVLLSNSPAAEGACIECIERDGQMADVDVTSPKVWDGESDTEFEEGLKRGESDKEVTRVSNNEAVSKPQASVGELTEQNIKLWLTLHLQESDFRHRMLDSYVQSQLAFSNDLQSEPASEVLVPWEPDPATGTGDDLTAPNDSAEQLSKPSPLAVTDDTPRPKPEASPRRPALPVKPVIFSNDPTAEGPCIECIERDRGMADVDVTSPGVWDRESDKDFEKLKRNERYNEVISVETPFKLRAFGEELTEQNIKLWLGVNPRERNPRQHMVDSYIQSQRTLVEEVSDCYNSSMAESGEKGLAQSGFFPDLDTDGLPFDLNPPPYISLYPFGQPSSEARALTQAEVAPTFPCRVPGCSSLGEACFTTNHTYRTRTTLESPEVNEDRGNISALTSTLVPKSRSRE